MYRDNSSGKRHNFWGTKKSTSGAGPANRSSREKDSPERICNEIWVSLFGNLKNHWQVLTFQFLTKKKCKFCVLRISQQVLFFRKLSADDARVLVSTALQVWSLLSVVISVWFLVSYTHREMFIGNMHRLLEDTISSLLAGIVHFTGRTWIHQRRTASWLYVWKESLSLPGLSVFL